MPIGVPDAVYAVQQQVAAVARNIAHSLRGEALVSAKIEREQWIEDMGKRGAAYLSAPQMPLRNINWLRRGRWVFDAKREFENYFINQILLGAGEHGHIAALVRRLRSRSGRSDAESKSAAPGHNVIISTDLRREIDILARHLGVASEDLSRQLFESAMAEARSYLDPDTSRRITAEVRAQRLDELQAEQERVRFEGGAP